MLRWIVSNWARQAARTKMFDAVSQAARASLQPDGVAPEAEAPTVELPPCRVLVVFALGIEAGGMLDLLREPVTTQGPTFVEHCGWLGQRRLALIESGVGEAAAIGAARDAIAVHKPRWVISAGFAGALTPELKRGHILMASHVVDSSGASLDVGLQLDEQSLTANRALHTGRLLTVDHLVRSADEKRQLGKQYGAVAVDMESVPVATICSREKVRFLSVRIISDAVDDELPKEIERFLDQKSLPAKLGAATGAIFGRPSSVKDMWKLKEDAICAADRLARFLVGVLDSVDE